MSLTAIILLILLGLVFIILELLIVPGSTFVGIIGILLMAAGIWFVFQEHGTMPGIYVLSGSVGAALLLTYIGLRTNTWKKFSLDTELKGKVNTFDEAEVNVGDSGKTVSRLAPSGKALINGYYFEVHTLGEFLNENTEITVIKKSNNKLIVTTKTT